MSVWLEWTKATDCKSVIIHRGFKSLHRLQYKYFKLQRRQTLEQYLDLCRETLEIGIRKKNRTGIDHIGYTGDMMKFYLVKINI